MMENEGQDTVYKSPLDWNARTVDNIVAIGHDRPALCTYVENVFTMLKNSKAASALLNSHTVQLLTTIRDSFKSEQGQTEAAPAPGANTPEI